MDTIQDPNPIERRLVQKANETKIPISATFELTPICNLHCDMCYIRMNTAEVKQQGGVKTVEEWLSIAKQLKEQGTLFLLLTGGEPLLYPNFKELYVSLKQMGFIITLNTNATLITKEIVQLFKQYPPRFIKVTLYGGSNETYHRLCHTNNGLDRCIAGVKLLKQYGIATKLTFTLIEKNRQDYTRMLDIAHELELTTMLNAYTSMYTRKSCDSCIPMAELRMSPEEVARIELDYLKESKGENYDRYMQEMATFLELPVTSVPDGLPLACRAGKSSCWINWQGIMTPCVDMDEPSVSLHGQSVAEAWQSIVRSCQELPLHTECKGCTLKQVCDVCYANATNEKQKNGNMDYLCRMAKEKKKLYLEKQKTYTDHKS